MSKSLDAIHINSMYRKYLQRIDVQQVLDYYGAENQREQLNKDRTTTEVIHSCLVDRVEPHHANGDQNPSACANLDKKKYICFGYWQGDIIQLIMKMERKDDLQGIVPVLAKFLQDATLSRDAFIAKLGDVFGTTNCDLLDVSLPSYAEQILIPWSRIHPYLVEERGIDLDTCRELQLGYDSRTNRIVFPHFVSGSLVGWQQRAVPRRVGRWPGTVPPWPKYKNSPGFPKSNTIYRLDAALDHGGSVVCLVESPMSVAKSVSLNLDIPTVATFGAKISQRQLELLRGFREVIVWMDDDVAGQKAEEQVVRGLYRHTKVSVVEPDAGKDMADYKSIDEVCEKVSGRVPAHLKLAEYHRESHGRHIRDLAQRAHGAD